MTALTLKNLPEDLLAALRLAAERDRRSLTQEIIHLLEAALARSEAVQSLPPAEVNVQLAAWRKLAGKWESDLDSAKEAKAITARRTRGRRVKL